MRDLNTFQHNLPGFILCFCVSHYIEKDRLPVLFFFSIFALAIIGIKTGLWSPHFHKASPNFDSSLSSTPQATRPCTWTWELIKTFRKAMRSCWSTSECACSHRPSATAHQQGACSTCCNHHPESSWYLESCRHSSAVTFGPDIPPCLQTVRHRQHQLAGLLDDGWFFHLRLPVTPLPLTPTAQVSLKC